MLSQPSPHKQADPTGASCHHVGIAKAPISTHDTHHDLASVQAALQRAECDLKLAHHIEALQLQAAHRAYAHSA